jgi:hypothetical protein
MAPYQSIDLVPKELKYLALAEFQKYVAGEKVETNLRTC